MLYFAWMFPLAAIAASVAIVSGVLGFVGTAGTASWIAEALFLTFLVLFVIWLVLGGRPALAPAETALHFMDWKEANERCPDDDRGRDGIDRNPTGN
jgi:uncharacterized membrane protein YtjA (UPF0391 family)